MATTMDVGPSAAPMMAIEAASLISKKTDARQRGKEDTELCRRTGTA